MVFISCRKCRVSVEGDSEICPNCGANPQPISSRVAHVLLSVTLIGMLALARQIIRVF